MSGQYTGNFNNQVGGHRGNFNNPMMNQMNMGISQQQQQQNQMGGMMNYNQGGMMQSPQHQSQQIQSGGLGTGIPSPMHSSQQQQVVQQQQQQQTSQPQLTLQTPTTPNTGAQSLMSNQPNVQSQTGQVGQATPQQQNQQKEFNIVSLCRFGQETVQDIVTRFQEVFQTFRSIQLPNGLNNSNNTAEKKVQEHFRTIRLLFRRLRILYEKCNDYGQLGMEYTHVESLIPLKDDPEHKPDPAPSEEYKKVLQENRELIETAMLRNKQLREIIDRTRIIIWEINTMLSMRRS